MNKSPAPLFRAPLPEKERGLTAGEIGISFFKMPPAKSVLPFFVAGRMVIPNEVPQGSLWSPSLA